MSSSALQNVDTLPCSHLQLRKLEHRESESLIYRGEENPQILLWSMGVAGDPSRTGNTALVSFSNFNISHRLLCALNHQALNPKEGCSGADYVPRPLRKPVVHRP